MQTKHKWAEEICHMANGGEVEWAWNNSQTWNSTHSSIAGINWDCPDIRFRIKPKKHAAGELLKEVYFLAVREQRARRIGDSKELWEYTAIAFIKAYRNKELEDQYYTNHAL